jgi:hypothetical protein
MALAGNETAATPYDRPVGLISRRQYEQSCTTLRGAPAVRPTGVSLGRSKTKRAPCFGQCRRPAAKPLEQAHCNVHELIIAGCEPILCYPNIVFHAGRHSINPTFQRPLHYQRLMATNTGRGPSCAGNGASGIRKQYIEQTSIRRQRVLDPHTNCTCGLGDIRPTSINRFAHWMCDRSNISIP